MWLSQDVLNWHPEFDSGYRSPMDRVARPYRLLAHDQSLVGPTPSTFQLADALSNLKRAINSRLQHLEELYAFNRRFPKTVGALERLEVVGLARPFLIRQLFELRNEIEHNDTEPPSQFRCLELIDITWYFLKTTDYACKTVPGGVLLRCIEGKCARDPALFLSVRVWRDRPDVVEVRGWVLISHLSDNEIPNSLPIEIESKRLKRDLKPIADDPISKGTMLHNSMRGEDECYIYGVVSTPPFAQQKIWRLALETL